jgi:acyl-coenzyme A synthetase/AMP-(fatty) acid ligase
MLTILQRLTGQEKPSKYTLPLKNIPNKNVFIPVIAEAHLFSQDIFPQLLSTGFSFELYDPSILQNLDVFLDGTDAPFIFSHSSLKDKLSEVYTVLDETDLIEDGVCQENEVGLICFRTSGSTGQPCSIIKEATNLSMEVDQLIKQFSLTKEDSFLCSVPICHIYGFLWGYLLPKFLGSSLTITTNLASTMKELESGHTHWVSTPALIEAIFSGNFRPEKISLKTIISSGSSLNPNIALDLYDSYGVEVIEVYGSSETGGIGFRKAHKEEGFTLLEGVEVDIDSNFIMKIKSPYLSQSMRQQNSIVSILDSEGFFPSGDTGNIQRGKLYPGGRIDRIIKINGKRIHIDTVENMVRSSVTEVQKVVILWDTVRLKLFFTSKEQNDITGIHKKIKDCLPPFLRSVQTYHFDSIPLLANQKIDYQKLKNYEE